VPASPSDDRSTLLCCAPHQLARARALATLANLNPVAIAVTSQREAASAAFPDAEIDSDPRHAVVTAPARIALWLDEAALLDEPEIIDRARERGITLLTTEPWPSSIEAARHFTDLPPAAAPVFVPQLRATRICADLVDSLADLGSVRSLTLAARAHPHEGSLAARLFDAMLLVHALLGLPETIDATHVPSDPLATPGATPQALRTLHGDLSANFRFSARCTASIALSNHAGPWFRGLTLVTERGTIRATEHGLERFSPDGGFLDASPPRIPETDPGLRALADAISRTLDPRLPPPAPPDTPEVLAMCHAALLSARTTQAEPPATLLRMATRA
jgi:hypothetical protein